MGLHVYLKPIFICCVCDLNRPVICNILTQSPVSINISAIFLLLTRNNSELALELNVSYIKRKIDY